MRPVPVSHAGICGSGTTGPGRNRIRVIANTASRNGRSCPAQAHWRTRLESICGDLEWHETTSLEGAHRLGLNLAAGADTVVACGGDGTINAVVDGLLSAFPGGSQAPVFGVLYAGTSPDFCGFHGIPTVQEAALDCLLHGQVRTVDACRIEYHPGPGDARSSAHFTCSASVGLGAAVATVANRRRRRLGDRAGTASAVVQAVLRSRAFELQTWIDGEHCVFPDARHAMVCKNPRIASGLRLDLDLDSGDGRGALVVVSGTGRLGLLRLLPRFYTGSAVGDPRVSVRHGAEFRLETSQPSALEFDGDPHGRTPARIKVLHQALRLIVPAMAPDDPRRDTP